MFRRLFRTAPLLLAGVLMLSACSSGSGTAPTTSSGSSQSQTQAQGPVKLVVGAPADIQHWDIHNHNYTYTEAVHQHVFDYLVYMNPDTGKFDPGLATEWKLVNPTTWEFKLRDAKFQDGTPFTADDVKWTLERVSRDKTLKEYGSNRTIKEVQVVDPHTARIVTTGPDPILLNRLSRIGSGMLPSKFLQEKGWDEFQKHPFGTGAYKVKEWVKGDHLTLTAWDGHWRGKPKVDEITFRVIPEEQTRVNELTTGGIDIALGIGPDNVKTLKDNPDVNVYVENTPRVYVANIRTSGNYCTADPKVREAIDWAIDDKALGEVVAPGMITPTLTRLIPGVTGANPDLYNKYNYDPAKAKQLLADAGYTNGKTCEIGLLSRNDAPYPDEAQTIVGMLEKVGIKVKLELLDTTAYNKKLSANQNPDIYITAFGNSMKDADLAVNFALTEQNKDYMGYSNKRMDDLINGAATEMDPAKRVAMYKEISQIMATDRPQLSFFQSKAAAAVRKGVNWKPRTDEMLWLHDVTITKGK